MVLYVFIKIIYHSFIDYQTIMRFIQNLKLIHKLGFSFGLIIVILLSVNIYSNIRLSYLQSSNENIANIHFPAIIDLSDLKYLLSDLRSSQINHVSTSDTLKMQLEEDEMKEIIQEILKNKKEYYHFLKKNYQRNEKVNKIYQDFDKFWSEYQKMSMEFLKYSRANHNEKALYFLESEPKQIFDAMLGSLDMLMDLNKENFSNELNFIQNIYRTNVFINILLLLFPITIAVPLVWFLVNLILKPIKNLEKATKQVIDGNLEVQIHKDNVSNDEIGSLALMFQKMTQNLKYNQQELQKRERIRNGRADLAQIINESIDAQLNMDNFTQEIIMFFIIYTKAKIGSIYLLDTQKTCLDFAAGYAITNKIPIISVGEGLLGQKAKEILEKGNKKQKNHVEVISDLSNNYFEISSSLGKTHASNLIMAPFLFEGELIGIMEIGEVPKEELQNILDFIDVAVLNLGIGFHSQKNAIKVRELLADTQKQAKLLEEQSTILEEQYQDIAQQKEEIETNRDTIIEEQRKSDELLLNILPFSIAKQLKDTGEAIPQYYKKASVLFTDFKGFTRMASQLSPTEIIEELNYCFLGFDEIIEKYGLEKIKTIGDSYMCAGGLPIANDTNPIDTIYAALEIKAFMDKWQITRKEQNKETWHLRIGIHTGELVAGVVGKKKFAYDIWGDAVNIASRMESNGEADKINISSTTYQLIKDNFLCEFRGDLPVKNVGNVGMYFVNGIKPSI